MRKSICSKDELMRFATKQNLFSTKDVMDGFKLPYTSVRDLLISLTSTGYLESKSETQKGESAMWRLDKKHPGTEYQGVIEDQYLLL